ncbi:TonB-dependent receptor [Chloroherpeton thalassium ATCC 35110]|uniref:TonB-dependent receptor n=1 Tax=Chloroherpeton thalassium (strain ATCC 35110 / GB-78) TaxID=517418 RepID=B3QX83_CHLT3|nr:TonB-dependent receptor plug domain-containing protein [Chloroherpeton thalassium]ACF14893.1 TonB-dependent receptor [Chloroherpeton thalassium ATCC 35110]
MRKFFNYQRQVLRACFGICVCLGLMPELWAQEASDRILITAKEIAAMNVMKIQDVLNRVPGLKATDSYISIRGSSNVMVFMDDRPINDPTSSAGGVKWDMISLGAVESIEIHKSKGGAIYGDNTSGGVILITSKKISRFNGNLESFYGRFEHKNVELNLQGQYEEMGAALTASYEAEDGFVENSDKTQWQLGAKTAFHPKESLSFGLAADFIDQANGSRGLPESRTPNSRNDYQSASGLFSADISELKSRTYISWSETENRDSDRDLYNQLRSTQIGQKFMLPANLPKLGLFTFGAGVEWEEASGTQFDKQAETRTWAFFSKSIRFENFPLQLSLGARANFYTAFPNAFNPELKAIYQFSKMFSLDGSVNQTNNMPTFKQRYNETSVTKPNPNLKLEKATNLSVSFQVKPAKTFSYSISGFYSKITDRITYVWQSDDWGMYENFGKVTYQGVETSVFWQPLAQVSLSPAYMYLHAQNDETGYWLPAKPFHRITADVMLYPIERLSMTVSLKYDSKTYTRSDNSKSLDAYWIANFRADYRLGAVRLFIDVDNLFDKSYRYGDGYDAPPLEWVFGMNYQF